MANRLITLGLFIMLGVIVALTTSIFSSARKAKKDPIAAIDPWPFEAVDQLLNRREFLFFTALEEHLAEGFRVFPKVRLASFIYVTDGVNFYDQFRSRIGRKYADFLIVDAERMRVAAVVEYDDKQLDRDKTTDKMADMERILDGANIPCFHFPDTQDLLTAEDFAELNASLSALRR